MCQNSVLSHIPIEVEWLVLSVNQERTRKRQRHLPSVVTDSFAHEINNAFTYCQVDLSSPGFRVSSVMKQTRSFGQPASGGSKQLTETHWAWCWPSTLSWVEESCEPMPHQMPKISFEGDGLDWKNFLSQGRGLCATHPVLWHGLGNTPQGNSCDSPLHSPGSLTGRMISLIDHRKYILSSKKSSTSS